MSFIVVGVGGGVAAFKTATLVRSLTKAGHTIRVIPTEASREFVGLATWEALSGHPVYTGVFDQGGADHIEIARQADLIIIAPATADLLARLRAGMANDLLTTTVLASTAPVFVAPAMHTAMWENAATQDNIAVLCERGVHVIGPETGDLSSGDHGQGRMVEPESLADHILGFLSSDNTQTSHLDGISLLVTAGGTHEALDPVRFLGNQSTGIQGIEIACAAAQKGAQVTLIAANIDASHLNLLPSEVQIVPVISALDMHEAVFSRLEQTDALVMAAAVADFRPLALANNKIKKTDDGLDPTIELTRNPDILAEVASSPLRPSVLIGFAAETGSDEEILYYARAKAARKNADLLALNRVGHGHGFGAVPNTVDLLTSDGQIIDHISGTKADIAQALVTHIVRLLEGKKSSCVCLLPNQ